VPLVTAYHRPHGIEEALALLADPRRVPLAGGTVLNADRRPSDLEAVDLQALGLGAIEAVDGRLRLGATATLAELADHGAVPALVRRLARAELPSTLRSLATVGGTIAEADPDSVLLAALIVHDAEVELARETTLPLSVVLATGVPAGSLITAVSIDPSGEGAEATTGRTPADTPIVAAVARVAADGIRLALTGVATRPVQADPSAPTADLDPPGDFRGSRTYRLELARVLSARVLGELA
jgi:CO/xanthine dehydrogenase FAD-binding subunit